LKEKVNIMVDQLSLFTSEVTRVAREVGTEGKLGSQAIAPGAAGTWKELTDNVNFMSSNLTSQMRNIADITTAVANGDFSKKITADVRGEFLTLKETVNTMVDQLSLFTSEVTRVAREVGTEGKLGSQAIAPGAAGTWKDLTENVNHMAANLTDQVRSIAKVVSSVAKGDLKQKLTVATKGEVATLADTINIMVDQLNDFAAQVTNVAREVGVEGRLGGQANVPGAAGTWKDLTDNVNQLAANLTTQVRAISEVVSAVAGGDLTRSINMDARGEVETLKDTINQMIANLRGTTLKNSEQVWLKTNLARFTLMLQGQRDLPTVAQAILSDLNQVVAAQHSAFYIADSGESSGGRLKLLSSFAYRPRPDLPREFALGEGLVGQCGQSKKMLLLKNVPGNYIRINSSLGDSIPLNLVELPVLFEGKLKGVLELASFEEFTSSHLAFLEQLMESIGIVINTLEANFRTETLLKNLQSQQDQLQKSNQELGEKADQLALSSKYKTEFLSNMSHELRTPLNSMLILSEQLAEDSKNLTPKQVEYARTIHASGGDLLLLINDILDLAKVESGTMTLDEVDMPFSEMSEHMDRLFHHVAEGRGLLFNIELDPLLGSVIHTDSKRLEQIVRNLLGNAFKFTRKGQVRLRVAPAKGGWSPDHPILSKAGEVIAFSIIDTGIGIPADKQKIIFEAFQQAESGTSRKYGGTGLGLSISRELSTLLGGQLTLAESQPGKGSTFTLYLPRDYVQGQAVLSMPLPASYPEGPVAPKSVETASPQEVAVEIKEVLKSAIKIPETDGSSVKKTAANHEILAGRKVLVVDDDIRNIFAMTSLLEHALMKVVSAESGREALDVLAKTPDVDIVLMDIMMPEMDGYDTMRAIRLKEALKPLPIIALTAKAMKGDREKCIESGATDYITKPIDTEQLLILMGTRLNR
jgi:signal transduction histidine kinase/HAMP domain-containing protein/ActR/RegA family two-component response regulator